MKEKEENKKYDTFNRNYNNIRCKEKEILKNYACCFFRNHDSKKKCGNT